EGDRITLSDQAALSSNFQGIIISGVDSTKNTVELGGKTSIQVSGPFTSGIFVEGSANAIRLSSTAAITANGGSPTQPSRGVVLTGNKNTLTMQDSASIIGSGLGSTGVQVFGTQDSVTLNDKSSIVQNAAPNNG